MRATQARVTAPGEEVTRLLGSGTPILRVTGWVSGHALKHLLAAAAVGMLAWMLAGRRSFTLRPGLLWSAPVTSPRQRRALSAPPSAG